MIPANFDKYPVCENSGIGNTIGGRYQKTKQITTTEAQNASIHISLNNMQLYGVCSGFNNGMGTAQSVLEGMARAVFYDNPINMTYSSDKVKKVLTEKFTNVSKTNRETKKDHHMELFVSEEDNDKLSDKFTELGADTREGWTAIFAFQMDGILYVVKYGSSMALAVTSDNGQIVRQLNPIRQENEEQRLLDSNVIPVDQPDVFSYPIENSWKYIVLLSVGVVNNLNAFQSDIPKYFKTAIVRAVSDNNTETTNAQSLVDMFAREHMDAFFRHFDEDKARVISNQREEMTIIFVRFEPNAGDNTYESSMSTMNRTLPQETSSPLTPYVDLSPNYHNPELLKFFP